MNRSLRELPTRKSDIAKATQRLGPCFVGRCAKSLELVGARGDVRRDFVVQLTIQLIAPQRRVTKEPAKAAAHRHILYAGLRDPRMIPSSRSAYSLQRSVSARSCARPGAVSR